ncbi:MAG: hypothetical protein IJ009_01450 [Clostridia bacterium]|nr:hypothetical protein [Clostridia bacterium]
MKKITIILLITATVLCSFLLSSCDENGTNTTSETPNTQLAENILQHIEEWEYVCDSCTKKYTYDDVEASSLHLYTTNTRGEYYLGVVYQIKTNDTGSSYILRSCQRMYFVTDTIFNYLYSSEYSVEDRIVEECELLSWVYVSTDKPEYIKQLAYNGLEAEKEYFEEITLSNPDTISLTSEQQQLFDNMYATIKELEYYEPRNSGYRPLVPLAQIEYYILGNGRCEALLYHGYTTEYGGSYYVGGYSIDSLGHQRLSNAAEDRLENSSKTIKLNWNVDWTDEKKIYMLKQSIHNNS